jgi:hypothetical protein
MSGRDALAPNSLGYPPIVLVLVLDFLGRGKRADCQQRSKIENEDDDEDESGARMKRRERVISIRCDEPDSGAPSGHNALNLPTQG